jgi:uncharacterized protein (DUF2147 family)
MRCIAPHMLAAMIAGMASTISYAQEKPIEDDLIGEWILPENGSVIRAHRCGDRFCDSDVKVAPPKRWDSAPRRSGPGILIPSNLQRKGPATWRAEFYNLRDGETYEGTIKLIDKNRLSFIRCIIGSVLCETVTFHRIDPPKAPEPEKQERRPVSADRLEVAKPPLPKVKAKAATRQPTRADFEAFLKERGINSVPTTTAQEEQALFREFMAWRSKR